MVTPQIYLDDMYEYYQKTQDMDVVLRNAAKIITESMKEAAEINSCIDITKAKDNIIFQVINTAQNQKLLHNIPSRQFHDLSIVYRWVISEELNGAIASTLVNNELASRLSLDEEQLHQLALENTRRILPPTIKSLSDLLTERVSDEMNDDTIAELTGIPPYMWIIGNTKNINGAGSMLYEDVLHELAERINSNLFILPSSIHEVIALSAENGDAREFLEMVTSVNANEVSPDERLSNSVYFYDRTLRELSVAACSDASLV